MSPLLKDVTVFSLLISTNGTPKSAGIILFPISNKNLNILLLDEIPFKTINNDVEQN